MLKQTIDCLLKQDPAPKEIIVIDQTRQHDQETSEYLDHLVANKEIIYIYQAQPNAQRARNRAIAESTGKVLLFVDDDVKMDSDLIGAHWRNYDDPEIAAVCGYYTNRRSCY